MKEPKNETKMVRIGTEIPEDTRKKLKWLAYVRDTSISALIAMYVEQGVAKEDMSGFVPPSPV